MKKNVLAASCGILLLSGLLPCVEARAGESADSVATIQPLQQAQSLILSREQCVQIALSENPTIKVADMEVTRMDYSKRETLAQLFPDINFAANYQRSIELQTMKMNMGGSSQSIKMGSDNTWSMGFQATMPLVAPQLWKSINISDTQILRNVESARASRLDMVNQVNQAYYTLLLAEASKQVIEQNYDNAKFNADLYEKQYAAGTASEYDVLRSQVQVKNIEPELLQADIAIKQAKLQLKILMGLDLATEITPDVTLQQMQQDMYAYTMGLDTSLADNTQMRTMDIDTELLKQTLSLRKRAFIPTLAATFNLNWLSMSNGNALRNFDFTPYSNVGLTLAVPIFSGGKRYYGVKQVEVQLAEMTFQRENLENSLKAQVELAVDNINKEVRQISSNAEGVRQADKAYEIMQRSFEIGAATYLDLRDSELAQTTSKLAYYQAIYNYLISTSELDLLLGRGLPNQ
ncbi:MAG: TolC family protein [Bacteroidales bacterium]|nr:TolC family protein [Bacteroidales bacterium]